MTGKKAESDKECAVTVGKAYKFSSKPGLESESENRSVMSDSLRPHELYHPWNSSDQNTGVGSLSLLQGIYPTQGSNPCLLQVSCISGRFFTTEPPGKAWKDPESNQIWVQAKARDYLER